jgi:hypothetical protein
MVLSPYPEGCPQIFVKDQSPTPKRTATIAKGMSSKVWVFRVGDHMVSINEELKAAKAAQAAINVILTATPKSEVLSTLKNAYRIAVLNLSSGGLLNEARGIVGIALSNVMHGLPSEEKINKAKSAIDTWIANLEHSL